MDRKPLDYRLWPGLPGRVSLFLLLFFSFSVLSISAPGASATGRRTINVARVIDGDTIVTTTGEHIRYIGIDTPERGEPFFREARKINRYLLQGGGVGIVECGKEKKDRYGRTLAWVYAGGRLVNGELLSRGLARPLFIPPCGLEKRALMERLVWQARSAARGIWRSRGGSAGAIIVTPEEAARYIGRMATVSGRVRRVKETPRALFVEFGGSERDARGSRWERAKFTVVIFPQALAYFRGKGMEPLHFSQKTLSVTGVLREYKGSAEIILVDPGQVRVMGKEGMQGGKGANPGR